MPRESYQQQLDSLRGEVVDMAEDVFDRLDDALEAIETGDETLAREVIAGDGATNNRYLELERECVEVLALQQPVASDLRFVAASFKIITDLERISDLAVNLGEYTIDAEETVFRDLDIQHIGEEAQDLVAYAIIAYKSEDPAACYEIAEWDDALDSACEEAVDTILRDLLEKQFVEKGNPPEVQSLMNDVLYPLLTIRDLERVGDHGVNIAARTLYMVEADDSLIY